MIYKAIKRLIDIIGSTIGLTIMAPVMLIVALFIKIETMGPAFVTIPRVSKGKTVHIIKLRSMVDGAHGIKPSLAAMNERNDGPFFKIRHDPRLTQIGKIIRRTRIDELPQLINVLKGDLSLVGPRPHEPEEVVRYPKEHQHLMLAKSGLTGLSQISGASSLPFHKELELDSHYINHQNLWMDAKILAKTIAIFFFDPTAV
ncbi:MAG: multidrug MFS transporter [Candidatus Harrisonbacteria bacterium CG10_big_fil_rev_8_21_14_0_10_42_17]|uniref:Multidrug MFS transporter n=1 Tax=Candidatus Harrisonbacteria bacterium CG10_big_fil_rev_8_21_14_0_10_42_17 TaxID=1974584 RepID=A0A2M6WJ30_9BACT|nr:MAG: multidrug MFS transporter [Candidatus Harrisonbacteria bacterium CG10_big_fil_rev_8_21_14_0_10_42_17]